MKNIIVLVDFSATADNALDQAIAVSDSESSITVCHVKGLSSEESHESEMADYLNKVTHAGLKGNALILEGSFLAEVSSYVEKNRPDLIVVGTHGKHGIKQNLFGSMIYDLVSSVQAPFLIVSEGTSVKSLFEKVLVPVSPHDNFMNKIEASTALMSEEGHLILFDILKPGVTASDKIVANIEKARQYLSNTNLSWEYLEVDAESYSVGYSKDTLAKVGEMGVDLISIMSEVSDKATVSAMKMDKENVILNEEGVAVLAVNG